MVAHCKIGKQDFKPAACRRSAKAGLLEQRHDFVAEADHAGFIVGPRQDYAVDPEKIGQFAELSGHL